MLLSALTLAAALQATPFASQAAPAVVIPDAAPVVAHKGHWLQPGPFDTDQRVDQPRMPPAKSAKPLKKRVVRSSPAANCGSNALQKAAYPETLKAQPLSKLPKAHGEWAVARLADGCPVPVLIARNDPLH